MTDITLLDGGMGQELVKRSGKPAAPLWSTQVMLDHPGLVAEVHRAYAAAGATVATTNTYAIHRDRLKGGASNHYAADGVEIPDMEDQLEALHRAALSEVANLPNTRVAGAIGPLGASYRADLHPDEAEAIPLYTEIAEILAPEVDILLFETIASLAALRACLRAGRTTDKPVWLAITLDDEDGTRLRSGETVAEAARIAKDADALLANCSAPEAMPAGLAQMARAQVPFGAYANGFTMITKDFLAGGTTADDLKPRRDLSPQTYADHAMGWVDHGATIIGGCCEVGPEHIAEIATRLKSAGHTIT